MHWHLKKGNNIIIKRKRTSADLNNNQFTFKEATDYAKTYTDIYVPYSLFLNINW